MRYYLKLIRTFIQASLQQEMAYRTNFLISFFHSLLNFGTGILGLVVVFDQVETVRGWDFASTLAVLGVYLTVGALRGLVFGPSLESLAGMEGEVWSGRLDFTLMRPVNFQFLASLRQWRVFALFDLMLGLGMLGVAIIQLGSVVTAGHLFAFVVLLFASLTVLYAILLIFAGLTFWSPGFLFTWVFDSVFQMARYPAGLYPGWLRLVLVWVIPVGFITSIPAQSLTGDVGTVTLIASLGLAAGSFLGASILFRAGVRRYASASS
jgi:ABC-2 type transport system permease protein